MTETDENEEAEIEMFIYDKEEIYPNCTVQVLTNTLTGETSVGWWINGESSVVFVCPNCGKHVPYKIDESKDFAVAICERCKIGHRIMLTTI